jgi:ABC-type antimicrobial peptide transport system permease subunit
LGRGLATVGAGLLLGIGAAVALTRFMESLLFETTPNNPIIFGGVAGLLLISAAAACWIPAHRAATADPLEALRAE